MRKIFSVLLTAFLLLNFCAISVPASAEETTASIFQDISGEEITVSSDDGIALNIGTQFASKVSGKITKIRIYTCAAENGTYPVSIYESVSGLCLASYDWQIKTGIDGWQEFTLPEPFEIDASVDYTVAVMNNDDSQHYSFIKNYFIDHDFSDSLFVLQSSSGVYTSDSNSMPSNTNPYSNPAFLRDIVFVPDKVTSAPIQDDYYKDAQSVFASDLKLGSYYSYKVPFYVDSATEYEPLAYSDSLEYEKGFSMHASSKESDSYVEINIDGLGMKTFVSYVGIAYILNEPDTSNGTMEFIVSVDGNEVTRSKICTRRDDPELITADITGGKMLRLSVSNGGDSTDGDLGLWCEPIISKYATAQEIYDNIASVTTPKPDATPDPPPASTSKPTASITSSAPSASSAIGSNSDNGSSLGLIIGISAAGVVVIAVIVIFILKKNK